MRSLQILAALRPRLLRRRMRYAFDAWSRGGVYRVEGYVDEVPHPTPLGWGVSPLPHLNTHPPTPPKNKTMYTWPTKKNKVYMGVYGWGVGWVGGGEVG